MFVNVKLSVGSTKNNIPKSFFHSYQITHDNFDLNFTEQNKKTLLKRSYFKRFADTI